MRRVWVTLCLLIVLLAVGANAQQVEFNYEGRVLSSGIPFTGPGYFKFAIVDNAGTLTLWSNDQTSTTGDEPAAAVVADVTDGVFNVIVGDASGFGMEPLDASLFNVSERVKLRVWFSDSGVADSFEQLNPDRAITNPGLLGSQSYQEIALFVDPVLGNDKYPGNFNRPKRTIQAAWNALPSLIRKNATIYLRDGIYREEVLLTGKTVVGDATIAIVGNITTPTDTRVTGADAVADTTPVRNFGFRLWNQQNVVIQGVLVDYTILTLGIDVGGIYVDESSAVIVKNCLLRNNRVSVWARNGSSAIVEDSTVTQNSSLSGNFGIWAQFNSRLQLKGCLIENLQGGVVVDRLSSARIWGCTIQDCTSGALAVKQGNINFDPPNTVIKRCGQGVKLEYNSLAVYANTRVDYGTGTDANGINTKSDGNGSFFEQ